jgi:hypothetical protein
MNPTYTVEEAENLVPALNNEELKHFQSVFQEEIDRYVYKEVLQMYILIFERVVAIWRERLNNCPP